jgi:hypothetical protein
VDGTSSTRGSRLKGLGLAVTIAAVAIAAALGLFMVMGVLHDKTVASDIAQFDEPVPEKAAGYLDVRVKIVALDLNRETVGLQLVCIPKGDYLVGGEGLKRTLVITAGGLASGMGTSKTISPGDPGGIGGIIMVDLDLDGNVADYPWDRHTTSLWLSAHAYIKGKNFDWEIVPIRLQAYGAWPGLDIAFRAPDAGEAHTRQLDIAVARSTITTVVVCFSILLTWILIAVVVGMTGAVALGGRKAEISSIALFGMLLFAMTAFRNSLPGAPPMGAFSDYLAFFWGYAVAIVAIGVLSGVWLWRSPSKNEHARR